MAPGFERARVFAFSFVVRPLVDGSVFGLFGYFTLVVFGVLFRACNEGPGFLPLRGVLFVFREHDCPLLRFVRDVSVRLVAWVKCCWFVGVFFFYFRLYYFWDRSSLFWVRNDPGEGFFLFRRRGGGVGTVGCLLGSI